MAKTTRRAPISINIVHAGEGAPANKLADAELLFHEGPLAGLKLAGFAVWTRKDGRSDRWPGSADGSTHRDVPLSQSAAEGDGSAELQALYANVRPGSPVTSEDLAALGVSADLAVHYVRAGWLLRLARGVFARPDTPLEPLTRRNLTR